VFSPQAHPRLASGIVAAIFALPATLPAAINIEGFTSATNDRFANDPQFIADNFDLSGVGIADNGRWVTMVSENVFLSAHHFHPSDGTNVTFHAGNDPNGFSTARTVAESQRIRDSDLRIGRLDTPLGNDFSPLPFVSSLFLPQEVFMFGRSPSSRPVNQDIAVGKNVLDGSTIATITFEPDGSSPDTTDTFATAVVDEENQGNFVPFEAFLQAGDSGAPVLMEDGNGGLTIVGTNSFIGTNSSAQDVNGITFVGFYADDIQSFIDAHPVPEPDAFAVILGGAVLLLANARRQRGPRKSHD